MIDKDKYGKGQSLTVGDRRIKSTMDYDIFRMMNGNRAVERRHVKELKRLLEQNGNLTNQFPIVVNDQMEVIDGQHRLQALKELGWEVAYIQEEGATLNMVRAINLGNRNWNWRDIAQSYADLGNHEYAWFLRYVDQHNLGFSLAIRFCGVSHNKRISGDYYSGYLSIPEKTKAVEMAEHFTEALKYAEEGTGQREFGYALHKLSQSPHYNRDRMITKLREKAHVLPLKATAADFMRHLEDLYNDKLEEQNRVRLF